MNADKRLGFNTDYETVAASQTDQVLGTAGAVGDLLERLVVSVATAATGTVSIKDGAGSAIPITAANTPIGVYSVNIGAKTTGGAWSVTTGAGATVVAVGKFS
jgi:hypothetical protein